MNSLVSYVHYPCFLFILGFSENPLTRFVELPEEMEDLQYSCIYCGAIRGALEMVHVDLSSLCLFVDESRV